MTEDWKGEACKICNVECEGVTDLSFAERDLLIAERAVCRLISVPLDDEEYAALVSFTFNLGGGALQSSTLRMKVNRGEYYAASFEFKRWIRAGGKILKGLVRRREAERQLFLTE